MTDVRAGWQLPEQHLLPDAIVAFVDGELTELAHNRAAAHIRTCLCCTSEVVALRQARGAVRKAASPAMPASLLDALRSIPQSVELTDQPDGLAINEDGELVALRRQRPDPRPGRFAANGLGSGEPLGGGTPLGRGSAVLGRGRFGRRGPQGAGVVVSGLVLGALAFAAPHSPAANAGQQQAPARADRVAAAGTAAGQHAPQRQHRGTSRAAAPRAASH